MPLTVQSDRAPEDVPHRERPGPLVGVGRVGRDVIAVLVADDVVVHAGRAQRAARRGSRRSGAPAADPACARSRYRAR